MRSDSDDLVNLNPLLSDLRQIWQLALSDVSEGIAPEEVLDRLERKYQALADRNSENH
jgi:hypothetical protein